MLQNIIVKIDQNTYLFSLKDKEGEYPKDILKILLKNLLLGANKDESDFIYSLSDYFGKDNFTLTSMNKRILEV